MYGAGRFNHLLACGLTTSGYRVTCAQSLTADPLIAERRSKGIGHATIPPEDLYDPGRQLDAGRSVEDARQLFALLRPDLILFSDGSQLVAPRRKARGGRVGSALCRDCPLAKAGRGAVGSRRIATLAGAMSPFPRGGGCFSGKPGVAGSWRQPWRRANARDLQRGPRILLRAARGGCPTPSAPGPRYRRRCGPCGDNGANGDRQGLPVPDRSDEAVAHPARVVAPALCLGRDGYLRGPAASRGC